MAGLYVYKVRDQLGRVHSGEIEADSKDMVVSRLRQSGYFVTMVESKKYSPTVGESFARWAAVTSKDMAIFFRQFSTMVSSGLPLLKCLNVLIEQTEKKRIKESLEDIRREVESGGSLSQSMGKHPKVFPGFVTAMIRAGEASGVLDDIMDRLATYFEREDEIREKVKSALRYPAIVLCLSVLVIMFMLSFIIPRFATMFESFDMEMPVATQIILGISGFMKSYILVILILLVAGAAFLVSYVRTPEGRKVFDRLLLKVPVFGELALKSSLAKSSRSLGTLLASGIPIIQALEITMGIAGNSEVVKELNYAANHVREGESISRRLEGSKIFTPMMVNMIAVGEETGNLENMLLKVADFYDRETRYITDNLTSLIEPFLIVFLGVVIGGIMLSILMPMFDVYSSLGQGM